jgi:hypothetical protein
MVRRSPLWIPVSLLLLALMNLLSVQQELGGSRLKLPDRRNCGATVTCKLSVAPAAAIARWGVLRGAIAIAAVSLGAIVVIFQTLAL